MSLDSNAVISATWASPWISAHRGRWQRRTSRNVTCCHVLCHQQPCRVSFLDGRRRHFVQARSTSFGVPVLTWFVCTTHPCAFAVACDMTACAMRIINFWRRRTRDNSFWDILRRIPARDERQTKFPARWNDRQTDWRYVTLQITVVLLT